MDDQRLSFQMDQKKHLKKILFSISCHEAIEDAVISAFLVRKNFINQKIYIRLTITDKKNVLKEYKDFFDEIIEASVPKVNKKNKNYFNQNIGSIRLFNSIINSGRRAKSLDYDFIVYLNSGSWIINSNSLIKIINKILKNKIIFATRIQSFLRGKAMYFDDHFLIINLALSNHYDVFSISNDSRAFLPIDFYYGGIHKNLFTWFSMFPKDTMCVYSDLSNSFDEYGRLGARFIPLSWDHRNQLLHSNSRYKDILKLRVKYLDITSFKIEDPIVYKIIKNWNTDKDKIMVKKINNKKVFYIKSSIFSKIKIYVKNTIIKVIKEYYPVSKIDCKHIS